jgi:hypothetical protein
MIICPYCYENLLEQAARCPSCDQFLIDPCLDVDFPGVDKKKCVYCGKKILQPAKICKYCHKWLDELDRMVGDIDPEDLV